MERKRAQVTIFIILAIVIVAGVALFFVFKDRGTDATGGDAKKPGDPRSVDGFVETCLYDAIVNAIFFNPMQGGYFVTPEPLVKMDYLNIPIYWDKGQENVPTLETLEKEFGSAISFYTEYCVGEFEDFQKTGNKITTSGIESTDVKIQDKKVTAHIKFPISVKKEDGIKEYSDFNAEVPFEMFREYNLVQKAIIEQRKRPNGVPIIEYSDLAYYNNFTFEVFNVREDTVVYTFFFDNEMVPETKHIYTWAARYNW